MCATENVAERCVHRELQISTEERDEWEGFRHTVIKRLHSVSISTVGKCAAYACIGKAFVSFHFHSNWMRENARGFVCECHKMQGEKETVHGRTGKLKIYARWVERSLPHWKTH